MSCKYKAKRASDSSEDSGATSTSVTDTDDHDHSEDDGSKEDVDPEPSSPSTSPIPTRSESPSVPEDQYEIEEVLDYVNEERGVGEMYKIKWRNWEQPEFNTWEPPSSLVNCEEALLKFYYIRKAEVEAQIDAQVYVELPNGKRRRKGPEIWKIPPDPRPLPLRMQAFYKWTNWTPCEKTLLEMYKDFVKNRLDKKLKSASKEARWPDQKLNKYLQDGTDGKLSDQHMKELRKELYFWEMEIRRNSLEESLKDWQDQINEVTQNKPMITVENDVDFEGPPKNFKYVTSYIPAEGITIPENPPLGCGCGKSAEACYDNRKKCCGVESGAQFAYTKYRKVNVDVGTPIWECNSACSCGPECPNRVVQDGSNTDVKLAIFRTSNGCGWGVKALKSIKRGCFVCLYVGEVIHAADAERKSKADGDGHTYLFDLDFNDHINPLYTVDASKFGNVAHFINHSCDPNLGVYAVWVDCLDPNLPKLAIFAIRDIARGEELSFDYTNELFSAAPDPKTGSEEEVAKEMKSPSKEKKQECFCASENCRKFLFA